MSEEHVLGRWLANLGLSEQATPHYRGRINDRLAEVGTFLPFTQVVRAVCESCNHGWMGELDKDASRSMTPVLLGDTGTIDRDASARITKWAFLRTLTSMRASPKSDRATGYGLPESEYRALYESRFDLDPPSGTEMWIGQYAGEDRIASAWVVPQDLQIDGIPPSNHPHGYSMSLVIGSIVLNGFRFTNPLLSLSVDPGYGMIPLWPFEKSIIWPPANTIDDETFIEMAMGRGLITDHRNVRIEPWAPAADAPPSQLVDGRIAMPAICGKHSISFPVELGQEAIRGREHVFLATCECTEGYIVRTQATGAHMKFHGDPAAVAEEYDDIVGSEIVLLDQQGPFRCKYVPARPAARPPTHS
jgi:hypothetical protein